MSKLIPNSFQHPNILIDTLAYFLTPEENVVLAKAVREILGWHKRIELRKAPISLSVFIEGKFDKETGERLCYGCGLGIGSVRKALEKLDEFKILVKVGLPTQAGQTYWLQDDDTKIAWDKLKERRAEYDQKNQGKTQRATVASLESRGVTSDVRGNVRRNGGVTSHVTPGVTSDVNKETQEETQKETQKATPINPKTVIKEKFCELTSLVIPGLKREAGFWWSQFGEILRIGGDDPVRAAELVTQVVTYMQAEELTITGPQSIVGLCRSVAAGQKLNGKNSPLPGTVIKTKDGGVYV
jgi:hypothetical protein